MVLNFLFLIFSKKILEETLDINCRTEWFPKENSYLFMNDKTQIISGTLK